MDLEEEINRIQKEKEDLEEDYENGEISESEYQAIMERYEKELEEKRQELSEKGGKESISTANKAWLTLGLLGGALAVFSVILAWESGAIAGGKMGIETIRMTGNIKNYFFAPVLVFFGGLYILIGGIGMLAARLMGSSLEIGGIIVMTGSIWGFVEFVNINELAISSLFGPEIGAGLLLSFLAGLMSLVGAVGYSE